MFSAFKMWCAVITAYDAENPIVFTQQETDEPFAEFFGGRESELVLSGDLGTRESDLSRLFVSAADLTKLTGCSETTGRNWLNKFADADLVGEVDAGTRDEGTARLFYPTVDDPVSLMNDLHRLEGEPVPSEDGDLTEVTPGDFHHVTEGLFAHSSDSEIIVNVEKTEDGTSIKQSVEERLRAKGMIPTNTRNFTYRLRKEAGLTE